MKLKGTIASGWSGQVAGFDLFDIAQLLVFSGKDRMLRVKFENHSGMLVFRQGNLVHASTNESAGEEAFYEMARWGGGAFEDVEDCDSNAFSDNITAPTMHLIMEAARRKDESNDEGQSGEDQEVVGEDESIGGADEDSLSGGQATSEATETLWADLAAIQQDVAERFYQAPEGQARWMNRAETEEAIAVDVAEEQSRDEEQEEDPIDRPSAEWWRQLRSRWGNTVQVVVAWAPEIPWDVAGKEVSRLAASVGTNPPKTVLSSKGPSFVRIHPEDGNVLSLTFLAVERKHRYLFETLVEDAHVVLVHEKAPQGEVDRWLELVPKGVEWALVNLNASGETALVEKFSQLARLKRRTVTTT